MNKSIFIAVVIVIAALARFPWDNLRTEMLALIELAAMLFMAGLLWKENRWIALFLVLAFWSRFFPARTLNSEMAYQWLFMALIVYYAIVRMVNDPVHLLNAICIVCLVNALYSVMQFIGVDPLFSTTQHGVEHPIVGLVGNQNFLAALLAIGAPAFWRRKWLYAFPIILFGLVLSKTSMGAITIFTSGLLFFLLKVKGIAWVTVSLAAFLCLGCILYILFVDAPGFQRFAVWERGISAWWQNPWFGFGLSHWKLVFAKPMVGARWVYAHNEYIQTLLEMGIGAAVLIAGYAWYAVRNIRRVDPIIACGIVAIGVNSMGNFMFHIGTTALIGVVWISLFDVSRKQWAIRRQRQ